jgi:hypothetical protein
MVSTTKQKGDIVAKKNLTSARLSSKDAKVLRKGRDAARRILKKIDKILSPRRLKD